MGKILKKLVKEQVLVSAKGPFGGFTLNEHTLQLPLIRLVDITDGLVSFRTCVLRMKECNAQNPCPMHRFMEAVNTKLVDILAGTTLGDLMAGDDPDFIKSLSANAAAEEILKKKKREKVY